MPFESLNRKRKCDASLDNQKWPDNQNNGRDNELYSLESESFRNSALGVKRFFCNFCDFACFFEETLLNHRISDHEGGLSHVCRRCQRRFKEKSDVEHHILVEHLHPSSYWKKNVNRSFDQSNNNKCEECGSSFSQKLFLTKHMKLHTLQKQCKCAICKQSFTDEKSLLSHVRQVHTDSSKVKPLEILLGCVNCSFTSKSALGLRRHQSICKTTNNLEIKLEECLIGDEDEKLFKSELSHHTPSKFSQARKGSEDFSSYTEHCLKCKFCEEVFTERRYLLDHILEMHPVRDVQKVEQQTFSSSTLANNRPPTTSDRSHTDNADKFSLCESSLNDSFSELSSQFERDLDTPLEFETQNDEQKLDQSVLSSNCQEGGGGDCDNDQNFGIEIEEFVKTTNKCLICHQSFKSFLQLKNHVTRDHKPASRKTKKQLAKTQKDSEGTRKKRKDGETANKSSNSSSSLKKCLICKLILPNMESLKHHVQTNHALPTRDNKRSAPSVVYLPGERSYNSAHSFTKVEQIDDFPNRIAQNEETGESLAKTSGVISFADFTDFAANATSSEFDFSLFEQNSFLEESSQVSSPCPSSFDSLSSSNESNSDDNDALLQQSSHNFGNDATSEVVIGDQSGTGYTCDDCGRCFKYKWNYDKDQEMHRKQKLKSKSQAIKSTGRDWMLDCPYCEERFVDKIVRIQHIKKAHEAQPKHSCTLCGEEFTRRHLLIRHMDNDHNNAE